MVAVLGDVTSVGRSARDDMVQRYQSSGEEEEGEADGEDGESVVAYKVSGCCRGSECRHVKRRQGPNFVYQVQRRPAAPSLVCAAGGRATRGMRICRVGDEKRKLETLGWWISTRVGKEKDRSYLGFGVAGMSSTEQHRRRLGKVLPG